MVETGRTGNSNVGCSCDSGDSGFPSTRHRHNSLIGSRGRRPPVRPRWLTRGHEFPSPRRLGILGERVAGDTIAKGRSLDGGALMDRGRDGDLRRLRSSVGWWRRGIRPAGRSLPELPGLPRSPMSRVFLRSPRHRKRRARESFTDAEKRQFDGVVGRPERPRYTANDRGPSDRMASRKRTVARYSTRRYPGSPGIWRCRKGMALN